jgi:glycerol kinase
MLSILLHIKYNINVNHDVSIIVTEVANKIKDNVSYSIEGASVIVGGVITNLNKLLNDIISDTSNIINETIQNIGLSNDSNKSKSNTEN